MQVIRASKAGFCMGVSLALEKLENIIATRSSHDSIKGCICTLGPIIHNPQVLKSFEERGVKCIEDAARAKEDDFVLIRAHGITRTEEKLLRQRCKNVEDATCPKVKKAQIAIEKATASGATLLLFGEESHPEVRGLVSYAGGETIVFENAEQIANIDINKDYVLASQTTQDRNLFLSIVRDVSDRVRKVTILLTICEATKERQNEAIDLASKVDVMVVVGGKESGNTRRLANLCRESCVVTWHIETAAELDAKNFKTNKIAGLTAGASTPGYIIDEVQSWLEKI